MDILLSKISDCIKNKNYLEAEEIGWRLYKQNKNDFNTIKTLALTLLLQGKNYGSIDLYEKAINKKKNDIDIITNLAHLYLKIEEFQKSFDFCQHSIDLNPDSYFPYVTLLDLYLRKREFKKGYDTAQLVLQRISYDLLKKNSSITYLILDSYLANNKKPEAIQLVEYFYKKGFDEDIFYYHSTFSPETISINLHKAVNSLIEKSSFNNAVEKGRALAPLYFGLAKYNEKRKNLPLSNEQYIVGNNQIAEIQRYQPLLNQTLIKNIKNIFNGKSDFVYKSHNDEGLIFIVGMPRSGTTLVESIIASADSVISGGELKSIYELVKSNYEKEDEDYLETEDPGKVYLERINFIRGDNKFFIDKLPGNYHNVGFIRKMFPKSKIIYVKRDPWDNAISLYKQFYVSNIPYASTFFSLGIIYSNHEEMMRFWKDEMNLDYFTVQYEELVQNTEYIANQIFEYCKLPQKYNPDQRGEFFARTASKNQVTKEIHTNSIKKTDFEQQKNEFLNSLENQRNYWKS